MSKPLKIAAYVALILGAIWMGFGFYASYVTVTAPEPTPAAGTNAASSTPESPPPQAGTFRAKRASRMLIYGAGLVLIIIGIGFLSAHDITHFVANRVEAFVFDHDGQPIQNPEYEHAEEIWKQGRPLDAIQLMREYLRDHPREQYVALRIAEIYEKDLNNFVAAALEYEEILKKRLPPERWGWAAIHLANLYSGKLNKVKEAETLLHRIINEYGQTTAARKARQRLGLPEPVPPSEAKPEPPPPPEEKSAPNPPPSNLPPGFRPKSN